MEYRKRYVEILREEGAIVIERDENGEWPEWAQQSVADMGAQARTTGKGYAVRVANERLDRLATNQPASRESV
jgi:hypothetical protein